MLHGNDCDGDLFLMEIALEIIRTIQVNFFLRQIVFDGSRATKSVESFFCKSNKGTSGHGGVSKSSLVH